VKTTFLTHYYPPESGAPQTRIAALAAGLRELGWDVNIHTGFPHYPVGRVMAPYSNRPLLRETGPAGERVVRSAIYAAQNRGFALRLLNHASLCASALATASATGPADVVVVETPPLFLAAAGALYARSKDAALVVNVADRWPESAIELGALRQRQAIQAAEALERWIYRRADAITVPTQGLAEAIGEAPEAAGRVVRLWPAVDAGRFSEIPATNGHKGPLRVLYAGTIGLAHRISTLIDAAWRAGPDVVQVTVAGGGAEADLLDGPLPVNVRPLGLVPPETIPGLYARADAGVVLLRDRPVLAGALPTKLFECLAAGRPAVLSARGEAAQLIEDYGAGIAVPPEDPDALAGAFRTLHADRLLQARLGAAGREVATRRFDRAQSVTAWAALLERVVDQRARL
jgi:glycosyltransferase involved in cell wall biosynthesis